MDSQNHVTTHLSHYGGKELAIRKMAQQEAKIYAAKLGQFYGDLDRLAPKLGRNPALNLAVLATCLVRAVVLRLKLPDACSATTPIPTCSTDASTTSTKTTTRGGTPSRRSSEKQSTYTP